MADEAKTEPPKDDSAALKTENDALRAELAKLKTPKKEEQVELDLRDKVKEQTQTASDKALELKKLESSVKFNMTVNQFMADNKSLLPSEITEILKIAEKETYDSASQKTGAVKAAMVQAYFSIKDNLEVLTANQKLQLDDYLKLTKTGKEDRADAIYENLFEPAIESMRRIKKAEELHRSRNGFASPSDADNAYKERLMKLSQTHYMGVKHGA